MTLSELIKIKAETDAGLIPAPEETVYVNNHIHTTYSFSPYSPTKAVYMAWRNGLRTAGIMDHDSVGGVREFLEAAEVLKIPVTCGVECRVNMSATRLKGFRINNPDQKSVAYVAMHGIPHQYIDRVDTFLAPYRAHRNERNIKMCENINTIVKPFGLSLDFDRDVLPISKYAAGGSVTERHILFALVKNITEIYSEPSQVVDFLCNDMKLPVADKTKAHILAGKETTEYYEYDILGALKSNMVERFYVEADAECPSVEEFVSMVHENGGIAAYAYLGDVGDSVTGDKKIQKFEDDYLALLIDVLNEYKFDAITYMPTRNSSVQLDRIMKYCRDGGFFQISGEDINSPRQSFLCKALDDPKFSHLIDAAYTLINYENAATVNLQAAHAEYSHLFAL